MAFVFNYLALAHGALTSFSLMSSQHLSCSIRLSRSLMSPIVTHNPHSGVWRSHLQGLANTECILHTQSPWSETHTLSLFRQF